MYIYQAGQRTHVGGADPAPGSPVCNLHHLGCGSCTWEDHREKGQTLNKAKGGSDLSLRPALCGPGQVNGPLRASGPFTSGAVTGRRDKTQEALHESTQHAVLRLAARLCLTLCNPMDCSPPGSSVHGVLQVRILEWGAMACSRGSSQTQGSNPGLPHCRRILYHLSHQGSPKVLNTTTVGTGVDAQ